MGVVLLLALQIPAYRLQHRPVDGAAAVGQVVGRYIAAHWPEDALIAVNTAGSTPFHAPAHCFIDMLGLNDRHIARRDTGPPVLPWQRMPGHRKGDGAYVLARRPEYIILGPADGTSAQHPFFLSDLEIAHSPSFAREYRRHRIQLDATGVPGSDRCAAVQDGLIAFTYYQRVAP